MGGLFGTLWPEYGFYTPTFNQVVNSKDSDAAAAPLAALTGVAIVAGSGTIDYSTYHKSQLIVNRPGVQADKIIAKMKELSENLRKNKVLYAPIDPLIGGNSNSYAHQLVQAALGLLADKRPKPPAGIHAPLSQTDINLNPPK